MAPPAGFVRTTYRWIVAGNAVLDAIALRHRLDDSLLRAGGVPDHVRDTELGRARRYWVTVGPT